MQNKITFIGDVHGKFQEYLDIVSKINHATIQVGDFGLGFYPEKDKNLKLNSKDLFIRGNHDNPEVCNSFVNCLGDYGYDPKTKIFHVAGAFSIDKNMRTPGLSWWADEEVSRYKWGEIMDLYEKSKPEILVTHTIPDDIIYHLSVRGLKAIKSDTGQLFNQLLNIYRPTKWIFGHFHESIRKNILGVEWIGLAELETYELEF